MIIFRYIVKEVLYTVAATTTILLLIFLSTQFVHYLSQAAVGKYAAEVLLKIMMLQIPYLLGLLVPIGLYIALLMAYGRLHADREMLVMSSCGMSQAQLIIMTLSIALIVMLIVGFFDLWLRPVVATAQKQLFAQAKSVPFIETMLPGRFFGINEGNKVLYVEKISSNHKRMEHIFVAQKETNKGPHDKSTWSIVSAQGGYERDNQDGSKFIVIDQGYRYQGIAGQRDFQVAKFNHYGLRITPANPDISENPQMLSTKQLFEIGNKNPAVAAELQWRLSMPLSVLILALLAIPLSHVDPRQGRFAQLLPAMLIYIIYANMLFLIRTWIQSGTIPPSLGVWWLHGLLFLLALILLGWRGRWFALCKQRLLKKEISPRACD